jgi:hypothetical protein
VHRTQFIPKVERRLDTIAGCPEFLTLNALF